MLLFLFIYLFIFFSLEGMVALLTCGSSISSAGAIWNSWDFDTRDEQILAFPHGVSGGPRNSPLPTCFLGPRRLKDGMQNRICLCATVLP